MVIVGAGAAGLSAARAARETDASASILLLNGEDRAPYKRTKLSKSLADRFERNAFALEDDAWYSDRHIERIDDVTISAIDRETKSLSYAVGTDRSSVQSLEYRSLVLALGSEPMFPKLVRPHERGSFFVLRSARDAEELQDRARDARTVLVAGMGVLAVEVAHQLRSMGKQVTLAGATPQLMPRQLNARGSEILEETLSLQKVKLLFQEEILSFERNRKKSWSVEMLKHSAHYDMVVFCIGVEPRDELARSCGLDVAQGIRINEQQLTSDPHIFAAGDCARKPDNTVSFLWPEAEEQGRVAGINAVGGSETFREGAYRLESSAFGLHVVSIRKPRYPWDYAIDEFEHGSRYYALYWDTEGRLYGAIMFNDPDRTELLHEAVRHGSERDVLLRQLALD